MPASQVPIFTAKDAWTGGHYELALFYASSDGPEAAAAALWAHPALEGPFPSLSIEPWNQERVEATSGVGVARLPGGGLCTCGTYVRKDQAVSEFVFYLPVGSLSLAWPEVGEFPFQSAQEAETWEPRLENVLFEIAAQVFERAAFVRGLTGFSTVFTGPVCPN